jgi:putative FmdB family regulatory protein
MPTYIYRCDAGHEFELEQRITAEPLTECQWPAPGLAKLCSSPCRRIPTVTSFVLHGKGWAKDGYS